MIRALILDRDGIINEDYGYIASPKEFVYAHNAEHILKRLRRMYILIVISNQSGIARGFFSQAQLQEITNIFKSLVDAIYYCVHHPDEDCICRKPNIHFLEEACKRFKLKPNECVVIGDKPTDIEMGKRAGCITIFLDKMDVIHEIEISPDYIIKDLSELENALRKIDEKKR